MCLCLQGEFVGVFKKDEFTGDFVEGWKTTLSDSNMSQVRPSHQFSKCYIHVTSDQNLI